MNTAKDWQTIGLEALTGSPVESYERNEAQASSFLPKKVVYIVNGKSFTEFEVNQAYNNVPQGHPAGLEADYKFTAQDLL
jgi:hypothetical protein